MNNYGKKLIKLVIEEVDNKYIDDKSKMNGNLNDTLKHKYHKVGKNEEKYIEVLRYNIIYYKSIIKKLELILEMWVENGVISSIKSVEKSVENITNSSREYVNRAMSEGNSNLNEKDKKIFVSYDKSSGLERIEKIENDYKILNIYKDILGMVIREISSNADKYNKILDMSTEQVKIDVMNEIFMMINDILFNYAEEEVDFKDEVLVEDEELNCSNIQDEEKSLSFKKYVSVMRTSEILVRINNIFRNSIQLENIDEEDAFLFSEDYKDCISCVVLLMDYVSAEKRMLFSNLFRMYISGYISQSQFEETVEKVIIDKTFVDKRTWLECKKLVKSDFNMDNNNFFGESNIEDGDLTMSKRLNIIESLTDEMTVEDCIGYLEYSNPSYTEYEDDEEISTGFAGKIKKGLFSFSQKLKQKEESIDVDDDYDEEYEYEEYEEYQEDDYDDIDEVYEENSNGLRFKFRNLFSRGRLYDKEYDEYYEDEEDTNDSDEEIYDGLFRGDKSIQDENAVAILKLKEKNKRKDIKHSESELSELKSERQIAEEINKNSFNRLIDKDIVIEETDLAYRKDGFVSDNRNINLFDDSIIDGQITIDDLMNDESKEEGSSKTNILSTDEIRQIDEEEGNQFKPILGKTQRLNLRKIEEANKKYQEELEAKNYQSEFSDIEKDVNVILEEVNEDRVKSIENEAEKINDFEHKFDGAESQEDIDKKYESDENEKNIESSGEFEELENLKAMKRDGEITSRFELDNKETLENTLSKESLLEGADDFEESDVYKRHSNINNTKRSRLNINMSKINEVKKSFNQKISAKIDDRARRKEEEEFADETVIYPKKKMARDGVIIIILVVSIFFAYVYFIKSTNKPSVQETNNNVKHAKQINGSNNATTNNGELNSNTTKITQKTEAEKERDEIESKASSFDREAENYKGGKGTYYTVFVGATKSEDSAQSVAYNFKNRGVNAKVVRNGGYYMLKVGEYFDANQAYAESNRIGAKGIQNYVASQNKYYDLKIEAFRIRSTNLSAEQLKTDYNDLKNQISSTGKNQQYVINLDEIYNEALKGKQ